MSSVRSRTVVGVLTVILVLAAVFNAVQAPFADAAAALYPDLQTAPPADLSIETEKLADRKTHYLLRFDNTVENWGGRLEISANLSASRDLYQNVYDSAIGGKLVEHRRMMADLIFHPTHNHFHVTDFAAYSLYKKSAEGDYRNANKKGNKTSFCILDSVKVISSATNNPEYNGCNATKQGLSAGWGDVYTSSLPDQWVDLGTSMLPDGEYALHSTVDPLDRIKETNNGNNTAVTLFTVVNGQLKSATVDAPYCAAKPYNAQIGTQIYVTCDRLPTGETFELRWLSETEPVVAQAVSSETGELAASFALPESTRGGHYLYISSVDSKKSFRVSLIVIPTLTLSSSTGKVDQSVGYTIMGFSPNTKVELSYQQTPTTIAKLGSITTDDAGKGTGSFIVPSSVSGAHEVRATGPSNSDPAIASFTVNREMQLRPNATAAGNRVQIRLRGFAKGETVVLKLKETGAILGSFRVSNTGALNPSSANSIVIPSTLKPGVYHVTARGSTSGLTTSPALTIAKIAPTATPTKTATPVKSATPTPTRTPTATATSSPTATSTVTITPTATETSTTEPTSTPTTEATATPDGATETPTP